MKSNIEEIKFDNLESRILITSNSKSNSSLIVSEDRSQTRYPYKSLKISLSRLSIGLIIYKQVI